MLEVFLIVAVKASQELSKLEFNVKQGVLNATGQFQGLIIGRVKRCPNILRLISLP
jgi:hypothetical protein